MVRSQISLESELHRKAKARAAELGVSLAEYLRRLVAEDLGSPRSNADVSVIFDLGSSGGSDIARQKRRYVGEAIEADHEGSVVRRDAP